mmetsp:Transcript_20545/g.69655  ORF Transcript_20545/g.69655 Transcript_20545/m.69655 type:complete len:235 (-) Transcript_20545:333-1037(-)
MASPANPSMEARAPSQESLAGGFARRRSSSSTTAQHSSMTATWSSGFASKITAGLEPWSVWTDFRPSQSASTRPHVASNVGSKASGSVFGAAQRPRQARSARINGGAARTKSAVANCAARAASPSCAARIEASSKRRPRMAAMTTTRVGVNAIQGNSTTSHSCIRTRQSSPSALRSTSSAPRPLESSYVARIATSAVMRRDVFTTTYLRPTGTTSQPARSVAKSLADRSSSKRP